MLSKANAQYLLSIANLYSCSAITAIRRNKNLTKKYDGNDYVESTCIEIVENNDYELYSRLNHSVKEELEKTLIKAFCFITPETMLKLSDIVINEIENNNRACQTIHNVDAINALREENKELQSINSMLIDYAKTLNPKLGE